MSSTEGRAAAFRNTIEHFLKERLDAKLDKLQADDPKRADLIAQHRRETWLADAARRGARSLVTFGVIGSHHALATAIHARELGIDTTAVAALVEERIMGHGRQVGTVRAIAP